MKGQGIAAVSLALGLSAVAAPISAAQLELTTRVSGVVAEVLVRPGQRVKKGTVLVRLDPGVLKARLDEAVAEHARAEADEADAKRDLERAQELFNRGVSSTSELDVAMLRHTRARAAVAAAAARRTIATKDLDDAALRAPSDGVVKAVPGGAGTYVTAECQPKTLVVFDSAQP